MVRNMTRRHLSPVTWLSLLVLWLAPGCATTGSASIDHLFEQGPGRVVLSIQKLSCITCSAKVVKAVQAVPGVTEVAFERNRAEVGIAFEPEQTTAERIFEAAQGVGETVAMGAGTGSYAPPVDHPEQLDVVTISRGEEVDLAKALVPGKVTVVDFYADWCGPCRRVATVMNTIMEGRNDIALRKIDIIDWDTPVAQQHMAQVGQLPYTIVYDKQGSEVRRISGLDIPGLNAAIDEAAK